MTKRQFVKQRRSAWKRFEALVERFRGISLQRLTGQEITEYSRLMREVANDLATIRSRDWGALLADYLNDLAIRGHHAFYKANPTSGKTLIHFLLVGYPRLFRANIAYFAVACALFFGPLLIATIVIGNRPDLATRIIDGQTLEHMDNMYSEELHKQIEDGKDQASFGAQRSIMAGYYVWHNVGIALECFGRGVLLAIGTIYTLLYNGIVLGTVTGHLISGDNGDRFLSFAISHGSFELTAIAVAGGAGLMLGDALLHPGNRTRLEALRARGLEAVQIATGAAVMLMIAALIEGFFSPAPLPHSVKYAVGSLLWLSVVAYLGLAGREWKSTASKSAAGDDRTKQGASNAV